MVDISAFSNSFLFIMPPIVCYSSWQFQRGVTSNGSFGLIVRMPVSFSKTLSNFLKLQAPPHNVDDVHIVSLDKTGDDRCHFFRLPASRPEIPAPPVSDPSDSLCFLKGTSQTAGKHQRHVCASCRSSAVKTTSPSLRILIPVVPPPTSTTAPSVTSQHGCRRSRFVNDVDKRPVRRTPTTLEMTFTFPDIIPGGIAVARFVKLHAHHLLQPVLHIVWTALDAPRKSTTIPSRTTVEG